MCILISAVIIAYFTHFCSLCIQEIIQSGNQPNVYVYNSLMNVHAGDAEVVWQLYEDMRVSLDDQACCEHAYFISCFSIIKLLHEAVIF